MSAEETFEFGRALGEAMSLPAHIFLVGELGAGKTTLTRGLAVGFGVSDPNDVSSPTFTLVNRYEGRGPVYHVDLYRLAAEEVHELGLEEALDDPAAAVIVEWADRLGPVDDPDARFLTLSWVDASTRRIEVSSRWPNP
jgi:tRNA threonylcarbamoyladenosine biosynthesis protein TsaE